MNFVWILLLASSAAALDFSFLGLTPQALWSRSASIPENGTQDLSAQSDTMQLDNNDYYKFPIECVRDPNMGRVENFKNFTRELASVLGRTVRVENGKCGRAFCWDNTTIWACNNAKHPRTISLSALYSANNAILNNCKKQRNNIWSTGGSTWNDQSYGHENSKADLRIYFGSCGCSESRCANPTLCPGYKGDNCSIDD
ncbi:uncharacterized protein JN550_000523 [Neoarthrinium moseri]|uniref:uncharacterized protein n=1 Tax=Neoarthrinium moseri TaxID=1658444 RepID=UPI001FDC4D9A|nr:uncharacterized protein JN550_000523 [Neoarthrinium moseri]KAI1878341.1 hypothetical protein JN550_000523 [Neoarthrinium moseri]